MMTCRDPQHLADYELLTGTALWQTTHRVSTRR
jgi:hypothetical protein